MVQHRGVTQTAGDAQGSSRVALRLAEGPADSVREIADLIAAGGVVVLSGAGLSTESGIPDYRGPTGLSRRAEPMTYQAFTGAPAARQRYWARSHLGWRQVNPDGDAVLDDGATDQFEVVDCLRCAGTLKPDVIFFGENVPPGRLADCYALVSAARAVLVLGSSLTVMSGYRFVRHAARAGLRVAIINQGATRGDAQATLTLDAPLGPTLAALITRYL